jgi:hypothetical protein
MTVTKSDRDAYFRVGDRLTCEVRLCKPAKREQRNVAANRLPIATTGWLAAACKRRLGAWAGMQSRPTIQVPSFVHCDHDNAVWAGGGFLVRSRHRSLSRMQKR